ncbi:MAG: polyprenyl diphosphate synthase, partial [Nitrososphaeraceae archaeon]|nr:polyprenyl diphosphate synthase [Nitrososphaeraceae archaeon]
LSYSGRWELLEAIKSISTKVLENKLKPEDISEKIISDYLTTKNLPDPDLLIRTSGEFRVSNFLLWQIAYSEFVVFNNYWPEFSSQHLYEAIRIFQKRERRFGKVSEQVNGNSSRNTQKLPTQIV